MPDDDDEEVELPNSEGWKTKPDDKSGGVLPGLWAIGMLVVVVRGIDWISCDSFAWPGLLLVPVLPVVGFIFIVACQSLWLTYQGKANEVAPMWKEVIAYVPRYYHQAPKTWTVTTIIFLIFLWTIHGRYNLHYYQRGGTDFMRVEDHLTGQVKYRAIPDCPVEQPD